jgi:eukaryotic-like serine/threonine-protein kinase
LTISTVMVSNAQRETSRALVRVEVEQGRTVEALERADANFHRARQAVEDYFTTVSEEVLLDEPGMQPLREKLLKSALKYHEVFLKDRAGDASVSAELAESNRRFGLISLYTERGVDPLPYLRSALERFEALVREHPDRPEYRRQVAQVLSDIGFVLSDKKPDRNEATRVDRAAIAIYEQLLVERPEDETILEGLATTLASLGLRRSEERGGSAEAGRHLQRARDLLTRLVSKQPDSLRPRVKLAELHISMYNSLVGNQRRQDEALESSRNALAVYNDLLKRAPRSPRFMSQVGVIHDSRGVIYARKGKLADAIIEEQQARKTLGDVVRTNPENARYLAYLASGCMRLGQYLTQAGSSAEALDPLREACDAFDRFLKNRPDDMAFQAQYLGALSSLGSSLGRLGRFDESIAVLERAVEIGKKLCQKDPSNIFLRGDLMACTFNLAASLTRSGARHREAVAAYEESRSIGKEVFGSEDWSHEGSNSAARHFLMAYSLREIGREKDAERALETARATMGDDSESFSELASYDARGAQRLAATGGGPRAIEALEHRALRALARAVDLGFKDFRSVKRFGEAFQLGDRPEFRLILLDAAVPNDPFARSDR